MVGGKRPLTSSMKGGVAIKTKDNHYIGLLRCLQVPGFRKNILSISCFINSGATFIIEGDHAYLKMGDKAVKMDRRQDGMFYLHGNPVDIPVERPVEMNNLSPKT